MKSISKAAIIFISLALIVCENAALAEIEGQVPDAPMPTADSVVPRSTPSGVGDAVPASLAVVSTGASRYAHEYEFTTDWLAHVIPVWTNLLAEFEGMPNLNYLEVGVYEGRSFFWMLENVLTDPTSKATAVDLFLEPWGRVYESNLSLSGARKRVTTMKGDSQDALKTLKSRDFDIVYIDASHTARDTMFDALLAWDLLNVGGLMIFDDYELSASEDSGDGVKLPDELRPGPAIDAFITLHRNELEVLHRGYQVAIRRVQDPCLTRPYDGESRFDPNLCSAVGSLLYNWQTRKLVGDGAPVLHTADRKLLESFLRSAKLGRAAPPKDAVKSPKLVALFERMKVMPASRER